MVLSNRFVKVKDIPSVLWCPDSEYITLPAKVSELWYGLLSKNNLLDLAGQHSPKGFEGGISKEDTDKHLAWRYNGSCARVVLSMLDPKNDLSKVSDAYSSIFSGGKVFLADLPSGSGAAVVSILSVLYELRRNNVLPRHPLEIKIVAGEISEAARDYACEQLNGLKPFLEEQAIWIDFEVLSWDVLSKISTVDLIKKITLSSSGCMARLLVLSNFTGFLEGEGKWKEAKEQFDDIFLHSRDVLSAAIWIEPQKGNVVNFFARLIKWFKQSFKSVLGQKVDSADESWYAKTSAKCKQPIKDGFFDVRLTVVRFDLPVSLKDE